LKLSTKLIALFREALELALKIGLVLGTSKKGGGSDGVRLGGAALARAGWEHWERLGVFEEGLTAGEREGKNGGVFVG
jgi:hypothetical protein